MGRFLTMKEGRKGPHSRDEEPVYKMGAAKHLHTWEPTFPPKQFQSVLLQGFTAFLRGVQVLALSCKGDTTIWPQCLTS